MGGPLTSVWQIRESHRASRPAEELDDVRAEIEKEGILRSSTLKKHGALYYDPGFAGTACCTSRITYLDGANGILRYRGYPIEQLAERSHFVEVAYLLLHGELPARDQLAVFDESLAAHRVPHVEVARMISSTFRHDAHPMGVLASVIMAMGTIYPDANPAICGNGVYNSKKVREEQVYRILGTMPTIVASIYRMQAGLPMQLPTAPKGMGYAEHLLFLLTCINGEAVRPNPKLVHALDVLLTLHADHELNCSTATMRQLTSSGVDVYTSVAASIGALYGPLHGGANEAVLKMLERIGSVERVPNFLEAVKNRQEKLMGFGHRVYKNYDPRAKIVKKVAYEVFEVVGKKDPLIDLATALEQAALQDPYFVERKLYPNVDFYSGLIYKAIGFPTEFFTCLFAIGRSAGWLAHWNEFLDDPEKRIARPMQIYRGYGKRDYIPTPQRESSNAFAGQVRPSVGVLAKL